MNTFNETTLKRLLLLLLLLLPYASSLSTAMQEDTLSLKHKHNLVEFKTTMKKGYRSLRSNACPLAELKGNTYQAELNLKKKYCVKINIDIDKRLSYIQCRNSNCNCANVDFTSATVLSKIVSATKIKIKLEKVGPTGRDGTIVVKEDSSITEPTMIVIGQIGPGTAYELELWLPYCNEPSASPSEAPSISPSISPSMVPSSLPSLLPSTVPSSIPSVVPSALPSTLPSLVPSSTPSKEASSSPSVFSSAAPSIDNFCRVDQLVGNTYQTELELNNKKYCVSITLTRGESFSYVSCTKNKCDCANEDFSSATIISIIVDGRKSTVKLEKDGLTGEDGTIILKEDLSITDPTMTFIEPFGTGNDYVIELWLPYCNEPSASPSEAPSMSPSVSSSSFPSSLPSLNPTTAPSSIPSANPSALPSTLPSLVPSSAPSKEASSSPSVFSSAVPSIDNFCRVDELVGNTYQTELEVDNNKYCVNIILTRGGSFSYVRCTRNKCDCANEDFSSATIISIIKNRSKSTVILEKDGLTGEDGTIIVKEDLSITEPTMTFIEPFGTGNDYVIELWLPYCNEPSASPSEAPSMSPSVSSSSFPSSLPSLNPTTAPSSIPSANPSALPSTLPSLVPSSTPSKEASSSPSVFSSAVPSIDNFCRVDQLVGNTYQTELEVDNNKYCVNIILTSGGSFSYVRCTRNKCDCANEDFSSATIISIIKNGSKSTVILKKDGLTGEDGTIIVKEDLSITEPTMTFIEPFGTGNDYIIELWLPYCNEPSASPSEAPSISPSVSPSMVLSSLPSLLPSTAPSSIPSAVISRGPSSVPTTGPSMFPSTVPSPLPSSVPSLMPSLPTCDADDVKGKIYKAPIKLTIKTFCLRLDLSINGFLEADTSGKDCASATFQKKRRVSVVKFFYDSRAVLFPANREGYEGYIVVREDSSISAAELVVIEPIEKGSTFQIDLVLPSCTGS